MRYNVAFVEDEYMVRANVARSRIWQQDEFCLIGEASNGEDALTLLEAHPVDILLTDIRMPFMDGLELCAAVRERWPAIRIVILSGYSDFSYAQQAIRLGVSEYLIKPFKADDLLRVLRSQKESIEAEQAERRLRGHFALQKFLSDLASGFLSEGEARRQSDIWGLDLFHSGYIAAVASVSFGAARSSQQEALHGLDLMQAVEALLGGRRDVFVFSKAADDIRFFLAGEGDELPAQARCLAAALQDALLACDGVKDCAIAISRTQHSLLRLGESFAEAQFALTIRPQGEERTILDVRDLNGDVTLQTLTLGTEEELLRGLLCYGGAQDIPPFLAQLREKYLSCSALLFIHIGLDMLSTVRETLTELGVDNAAFSLDNYLLELGLCMDRHDLDGFFDLLDRLLRAALAARIALRGRKNGAVIALAQQFVRENYHVPGLSLTDVAQHVSMSPSYFSSLFRQETGQTLIEFITFTRIEQAKRLLGDPARRTTEISFDVGFTDPNYFSKLFRKVVGVSPREFRARLNGA